MNVEQRIAEETSKITANSYQKVASLGGWSGGGRTLWAISILGGISGAAIGLAAPFFPLIVGASSLATAIAALPASLAAFTSTGISMGFAGGLMLGRITGSAAAVAQEQEKRLKEWTARQLLAQNPNAEIVPDQPVPPEPKKSFGQRFKDNYRTYFNPRVGLLFAAIGTIGGLIMGSAFLLTGGASAFAVMPALGALTGLTAEGAITPAVIMAYTAGVCGTLGALWHFNYPKIASAMTHFVGEIMSGKPLGREWGPKEPGKIHNQTQINYNQDVAIADGIIHESMAKQPPRPQYTSFQELIAQQTSAADLGMKR